MDLRDNVETGEAESHPGFFYLPIPDEAPCKKEQEKLSGVVKNLHRRLRRKYKEGKARRGLGPGAWGGRDTVLGGTERITTRVRGIRKTGTL